MVWSAISIHGAIDLVVLEGRKTSANYIDLMEIQKINFDETFNGFGWIFNKTTPEFIQREELNNGFNKTMWNLCSGHLYLPT